MTFVILCSSLVEIHTWCHWLSLPWIIHQKGLIVNYILISFKFAFNQVFLESAGCLVTSMKSLGSGIKCDASEPDSPKV